MTIVKTDRKGHPKRDQTVASCLAVGGHGGGNHSDMDLIVEIYETEDKGYTQTGFVLLANGGCLDINYPGSKTRRARVIDEGRLVNAICCGSKPVIVTWDE